MAIGINQNLLSGLISSIRIGTPTSSAETAAPVAVPTDSTVPAVASPATGQSKADLLTGYSAGSLELLKKYDVRNIKVGDLADLSRELFRKREISDRVSGNLAMFPAEDRGAGTTIDAIDFFKNRLKIIAAEHEVFTDADRQYISEDYKNIFATLKNMADIHDVLVTKDAVASLRQMADVHDSLNSIGSAPATSDFVQGLSAQSLELLKKTDVRNISLDELVSLTKQLRDQGDVSESVLGGIANAPVATADTTSKTAYPPTGSAATATIANVKINAITVFEQRLAVMTQQFNGSFHAVA